MLSIERITLAIGAKISGIDFTQSVSSEIYDGIYQALLDHHVIFIRGADISPDQHLHFAQSFGELDQPHPHYPNVEGYENIVA